MPTDLNAWLTSRAADLTNSANSVLRGSGATNLEPPLDGLRAGARGWRRPFTVEVILDPLRPTPLKGGDLIAIFDQPGGHDTDLPKGLAFRMIEIWAPSLGQPGTFTVIKSRRRPAGEGVVTLPDQGPQWAALAAARLEHTLALSRLIDRVEAAVWAEDESDRALRNTCADLQALLTGRLPGHLAVIVQTGRVGLSLTPPLTHVMLPRALYAMADCIVEEDDNGGRLIKNASETESILARKPGPAAEPNDIWTLLRSRRK